MRWWLALALLCAALLLPFLIVDVPPLQDYPNHLARLFVLAAGDSDPVLSRFYSAKWGLIPDLGIDLLGVPLLAVLPVHVAGRLLAGVILLLPVMGVLAYGHALNGRAAWPFVVGLLAYNQTYLLGFLNFTAGLGLALLFAAVWLRTRENHPRATIAFAAFAATLLFFCHLLGVLFFALLIAAHELAMLGTRPSVRDFVRRVSAGVVVFAVPAVLYLASELHGTSSPTVFLSVTEKTAQLLAPVTNYWLPLDIVTGLALLGFPLAWIATGRCVVPPRAAIVLAALLALYAATPFGFKGTFNLDTRFIVMAGLVWAAALAPKGLHRLAVAVFLLLFTARMAVLTDAWIEHRADLASLRAAIAPVPPGATVFLVTSPTVTSPTGTSSPAVAPAYWAVRRGARVLSSGARTDTHMAALLVIERRAWWPFLFDNPSQQPIETRMPYRALAEQAENGPAGFAPFGFDYVLLLEAGTIDPAGYQPDRLELVKAAGFAALYRVR